MKKDNGDLSSQSLFNSRCHCDDDIPKEHGPQFSLSEVFEVELSNEEKIKVFFDEKAQIEVLYTDLSFYSAIGQ